MTQVKNKYPEKICCIFNYAPHYRQAVYKLMDDEFNCDFFFGGSVRAHMEKFDYRALKSANELKTIWFFDRLYWIKGTIKLLFRPYKKYLVTGQINCLSNWFFFPLAKISGKEIFIWNHGWYGKETRVQTHAKKLFYFFVKGFFLYGDHAKNLMISQGFSEHKLHVIYNSINYETSLDVRRRLKRSDIYLSYFKNGAPVLLFIGRLGPSKKLGMLIEAMNLLKKSGVIVNLVIIGDGPEGYYLKQKADNCYLTESIWFYGACYDEEVLGSLIYNSDICVSPGNVGLTAIHCLSYGTPVITHNNFSLQMPEYEAIIEGKTGAFFNADDLISLGYEINKWFETHPTKSERMIKDCYEIIDKKYNPEYQLRVLKEVLN